MHAHKRPFGFSGWRWELLAVAAGNTLEIGCGHGPNFQYYANEAVVTAFDIDLERVREAGRKTRPGGSIRLLAADAQRLPFAAGVFDSVVGTLVFCSIPSPSAALAEIRRILKPGGQLLLIEHVRSANARLGRMQDRLAPAWLCVTGGCHLNRNPEAFLQAEGLEVRLRKTGWGGLLKLLVAQ